MFGKSVFRLCFEKEDGAVNQDNLEVRRIDSRLVDRALKARQQLFFGREGLPGIEIKCHWLRVDFLHSGIQGTQVVAIDLSEALNLNDPSRFASSKVMRFLHFAALLNSPCCWSRFGVDLHGSSVAHQLS
ncbi:hypothetical protein [Shimia marina]|uniref:Uncharacterized protein n=1 Tax=Shimia marina TaxID=321267 RepID=A0A0P1FE73_9RHOB|nr:hypothetical protein [Shimia marina]CUH51665.1 hypothetical protein SHM7688_01104 [Shimia marina]SFD43542.1 hypothetical protein SAMN04488037_1012 [Shimia marina]